MESQGRIAKLSSDDLQAKLMQSFAENEELTRKLREAEDALRDKVSTIKVIFYACAMLVTLTTFTYINCLFHLYMHPLLLVAVAYNSRPFKLDCFNAFYLFGDYFLSSTIIFVT